MQIRLQKLGRMLCWICCPLDQLLCRAAHLRQTYSLLVRTKCQQSPHSMALHHPLHPQLPLPLSLQLLLFLIYWTVLALAHPHLVITVFHFLKCLQPFVLVSFVDSKNIFIHQRLKSSYKLISLSEQKITVHHLLIHRSWHLRAVN